MNLLKIYRVDDNGRQTVGKAIVVDRGTQNFVFECFSLELPWKDNKRRVSCIPTGKYACSKVPATVKFPYDHADVHNVEGRSGIKLHSGNFRQEILGCLIFGDKLFDINKDGDVDVPNSRKTLNKLLSFLNEEFEMQIIDGKP